MQQIEEELAKELQLQEEDDRKFQHKKGEL